MGACPVAFKPPVRYAVDQQPNCIAVGDFNGDGKADLVTANSSQDKTVSVLLGVGDGTFLPAQRYAVGDRAFWVAVGDFNSDGVQDLAVAGGGSVTILRGLGNGAFSLPSFSFSLPTLLNSVAVCDFNGDGKLDLSVTQGDIDQVIILQGVGDGTFQPPGPSTTFDTGDGPIMSIAAALNADAHPDLITANTGGDPSTGRSVSVFLGLSGGTFSTRTNYPTDNGADCIAVGDFNADGKVDLAVSNTHPGTVSVLLGNGDGTLQTARANDVGGNPSCIVAADFNQDGKIDLVTSNEATGDISVLLGNGDGYFQPRLTFSAGTDPRSVVVGDFNSDGLPDLAVATAGSNEVAILLNADAEALRIAYVARNATGANNGQGWNNAFTSLQAALAYAATVPCVEQIWVAKGTYKPALPGGDRNASFQLRNNLAIYGGFAGNEPADFDLSHRDFVTNETILSGDLNGDDSGLLNLSDNTCHIVTSQYNSATAMLDGFTITRGRAFSGGGVASGGGGALVLDGNPTFRYCQFVANAGEVAGAVRINTPNTPPDIEVRPLFDHCTFTSNTSPGFGGACYVTDAEFRSCVFTENTSNGTDFSVGGAVMANSNRGIYLNCDFVRNKARTGSAVRGGEVFLNCRFLGNTSPLGSACPGCGTDGGALSTAGSAVAGCAFIGNIGGDAGAIACITPGTPPQVGNCTFASNLATSESGVGGLQYTDASTSGRITNSIFWNNRSGGPTGSEGLGSQYGGGGAFDVSAIQANGAPGASGLAPMFTSDPSPGVDGLWGTPDDNYGNLRLAIGSPALDTGDNAAIPLDGFDVDGDGNAVEFLPLDLDGSPRIQNGTVDRGCYEGFRCPVCPDDREWFSSQSGDWADDSRWSFSKPDACHFSIFDFPGVYAVGFAPVDAARGLLQSRGSVVLEATTGLVSTTLTLGPPPPHTSCPAGIPDTSRPALLVSGTPSDNPSLAIISGTVKAQSGVVGDALGKSGGISLASSSAKLVVSPGSLTVGDNGVGALSITGGATCFANALDVGVGFIDSSIPPDNIADRHGTVTVSGAGSLLKVPTALQVFTGILEVSAGGTVDCVTPASGSGYTGTVYVHTGGLVRGDGLVKGPVFNTGTVQPLPGPGEDASGFVSLTIGASGAGLAGSYMQLPGDPKSSDTPGSLALRFGPAAGQPSSDQLVVNGPATLAGSLVMTSTDPTFDPPVGVPFPVLTATSIQQQFTVSQMPALPTKNGVVKYLLPHYPVPAERSQSVTVSAKTLDSGDITLNPPASQNVPGGLPAGAVLADIDGALDATGQKTLDLAVTIPDATNPGTVNGNVVVLRNAGTNVGGAWLGFTLGTVAIPVGKDPRGLVAANFDADGNQDLAVCNFAESSVSILYKLNMTNGLLTQTYKLQLPAGSGPVAIASADFNADGKPDLAVANQSANTVSILLNTSTPAAVSFTLSQTLSADAAPAAIVADDFDNDSPLHLPDIATANRDAGTVTVFFNRQGTHVFPISPDKHLLAGDTPIDIQPGNIDNSKSRSLVCVNRGSGTLSFFLNPGNGDFSAGAPLPIGVTPESITMGDLDQDGDPDIGVVTHGAGGQRVVRVLRNDITGDVQTYTTLADQYTTLDPRIVRAGDVDHNGRQDLVAITTVAAALRQGAAPSTGRLDIAGGLAIEVTERNAPAAARSERSTNTQATVQLSLPPPCLGDINNDRLINTFDLARLLSKFGQTVGAGAPEDLTGDGVVNTFDLAKLLGRFGQSCP